MKKRLVLRLIAFYYSANSFFDAECKFKNLSAFLKMTQVQMQNCKCENVNEFLTQVQIENS
jgi:hypothetical protein